MHNYSETVLRPSLTLQCRTFQESQRALETYLLQRRGGILHSLATERLECTIERHVVRD